MVITMDLLNQLSSHLRKGRYDEFIRLLNSPDISDHDILNFRYRHDDGTLSKYTLLHKAAECENLECIQELVKRAGPNKYTYINLKDDSGRTALRTAALIFFRESQRNPDCYQIIKFLIESGSDCNAHDNKGEDLLHLFCWMRIRAIGHIKDVIGLLLDHGANRGYVYEGQTAEAYLRDNLCYQTADFVRDYEVLPGTKGVHMDG
jgi:ankyrin repeat protein